MPSGLHEWIFSKGPVPAFANGHLRGAISSYGWVLSASFDEPNLVSATGLVQLVRPAGRERQSTNAPGGVREPV